MGGCEIVDLDGDKWYIHYHGNLEGTGGTYTAVYGTGKYAGLVVPNTVTQRIPGPWSGTPSTPASTTREPTSWRSELVTGRRGTIRPGHRVNAIAKREQEDKDDHMGVPGASKVKCTGREIAALLSLITR